MDDKGYYGYRYQYDTSTAGSSTNAGVVGALNVGAAAVTANGSNGTARSSTSGNTSVAAAASKRDKRRQSIAHRLNQLNDMFETQRDYHYREMLHNLQSTLSSLHSGQNPDFLEELTDLEEKRDQELVRLNLWEKYQVERAEAEYNREATAADNEYEQMTMLVKERLIVRLEAQRKKLREDKALLDIANDNSVFLSGSYGFGGQMGGSGGGVGGAPSSPGYGGSNGGGISGFTGQNDRRSLRRRQEFLASSANYEELSGLSGGGGSGRGSNKRRKGGNASARSDDLASDRDGLEGILFSKDRDAPSTRHTSKSYQGVPPLKPDEALEDIQLLRAAINRKRR